jgi:AraC-like DNA-binding protein
MFRSPNPSSTDVCDSDACLACVLGAGPERAPELHIAPARRLRCDVQRMTAAPRSVRLAVALIQRTYSQNVPLRQLARAAACSPWHLSKLFRLSMGLTLTQYRTQVRVAQALVRLREGERSLALLAVDLGFSHHSHFTAAFVRIMGAQPSLMSTRFRQRASTHRDTVDAV